MSRPIPPHPTDTAANRRAAITLSQPMPYSGQADTLGDLLALHDSLRRSLDQLRRTGGVVPGDLRARLAACEADLIDARFDNMPV